MNDMGWLGVLAWVLQPGAAAYALRLSRLFGTRRVGWFVCCAFLCLALLHIIHLISPRGSGIGVVDLLISVLLLIGLAHVETVFSGQLRSEGSERQLRADLKSLTTRNLDLEETNRTLLELNARRDRNEEELKESARQFRSLFLDNPQPMWIFDLRSLKFLEINKAALREYGFTEAELMALTPRGLHPAEDLDAFIQDAARPKSSEGARSTWQHYRKDGTVIDVEVTACDLFYAQRPARLVVAQNVSRRRALEKLEHQEEKLEALAQMAGGFVQQVSGAFTSVDERLTRLLKKDISAESSDELKQIALAATRAASLTRQLLTLSRKQVLSCEPLDLNAAVRGWMGALQPLVGKDIKLRVLTASNLPPIAANAASLQQVLLNLVLNARESMPSGGTLTIATAAMKVENTAPASTPCGHFACLTVSDTGSGMMPEVQDHLFEPFFTTRTARKAAGLGLAISRAVVKQHSGWIDFQTDAETGSEFRVFLPLG